MTALKPYHVKLEMLSLNVTKDVEVGTTNKVATHTFPYSNKKNIEHMGTDSDIMTLEFTLTQRATRGSSNVLRGWVRFLFLLSSKGQPVTLVHPLLGEQKIQILSLKQKVSTFEGATLYPEFTMEFEIVDADAFLQQSIRDLLLFMLGLLKVLLLNALFDSAFAQGFKQYKQKGVLLRSLMAKFGLEEVFDVAVGAFRLAKDGLTLAKTELALLDGKINSVLTMLNNGAIGVLGLRSRTLSANLRIQNRIASALNVWNNIVGATRSLLDFGKISNVLGYLSFVSSFDNPNISIPPLKRNEVIAVSDSIIENIKSYKNTLDKEVLSTKDFILTDIVSENDEPIVSESSGSGFVTEDSVTKAQALSKLSITTPEAKEILEQNDLLAYSAYTTMLLFMVDSVLNADIDDTGSALSSDSIDKITEAFEVVDDYFGGRVDENLHVAFTELKNTFEKYKVEIAPFIYTVQKVNVVQDILPNLLYNTNGNLALLEESLTLNDTLFLDDFEETALVYTEAS
jgi:hypothetical protein